MTDLRTKIVGVLNIEGAFCGTCDREPGDSLYCKKCERVLNGYADAVLAVLDLDKVRAEAVDEARRYMPFPIDPYGSFDRASLQGAYTQASNYLLGVADSLRRRAAQ